MNRPFRYHMRQDPVSRINFVCHGVDGRVVPPLISILPDFLTSRLCCGETAFEQGTRHHGDELEFDGGSGSVGALGDFPATCLSRANMSLSVESTSVDSLVKILW
jgi:hypothetical protein